MKAIINTLLIVILTLLTIYLGYRNYMVLYICSTISLLVVITKEIVRIDKQRMKRKEND